MQNVVVYDEKLGKDFTIKVAVTNILSNLKSLIDDENEDNPQVGTRTGYYDQEVTQESRDADLADINRLIAIFESPEETEAFVREHVHPKQPTKKNGSYSKGRVVNHNEWSSFAVHWEDHYGDNTPALRARSVSDYEATLAFEEYIVKY